MSPEVPRQNSSGFRVPKAIIRHAIWLYLRFNPTRVDELLSWRYDAALA
jgi:hypothetical protein